jgi:uncharacterized HAD superfamily protein/hypoxanthine phosphoribosyltransferase
MHFKSLNNLTEDIRNWIPSLDKDYDCVVGVPRSGMLVANILALKLGLPMADLDGFLEGRMLAFGQRFDHVDTSDFLKTPRKVLLVDDSISTGTALSRVQEKLNRFEPIHNITIAVVYASPMTQDLCDIYAEVVPHPRRFEWNILSSSEVGNYAFDLDGVLCLDPTEAQNDDGPLYRDFILNAEVLYLPDRKVGAIVTSRLEKFRPETEEWLRKHGVQYGALHMLDLPSKEDRMRLQAAPKFKAKCYKKFEFNLFIESDHRQAIEIARLSHRFVYSVDDVTMYRPGVVANKLVRTRKTATRRLKLLASAITRPKWFVGKLFEKIAARVK